MQIIYDDSTFWIAYGVSNAGGAILAITAAKWPIASRYLYTALFGWACWFNITTVLDTPEVYADYAYFAVFPFLVDFIDGWFSSNTLAVIIPVAIGQGLIALGMMLGGRWQRFAAIGAMTFFVAVMPLGIGSAFPATLLMGIGAFFLMKNASTQHTPAVQ
ncbi:MAG: hypothetical protein IPH85_05870 [Ignavibacteria bacterium]|nr:hypothetical protein [Ignavibacteria bacterium]MBK7031954.1 hypothetical protein [Ignavibacteria bacterium]MBK7185449.1 hypothetical protein [Ignavibacteria bacterium]MBK7411419.1 hypothetical protein [Ignavibacteria bacterium]